MSLTKYKILRWHLLPLGDVTDGGDAGDEAVLGVIKHQELRVGQEAVVGLVGQGGAVFRGVLR